MREILFRGKRIDNGEWVYGYYVFRRKRRGAFGQTITELDFDTHYIVSIRGESFEVDPSTVGQDTGLTDKNGKKIFEGDFLECISCGKSYKDVVVYGRWNCSCCDGVYGYALLHYEDRLDFREVKNYEICGNIHDNPELLEAEE